MTHALKGGDGPVNVNVNKVGHLHVTHETVFVSTASHSAEAPGPESKVCENDYLVILIKEDLGQCTDKKEALCTLEQKLCDRIRAVKKLQFSSFKNLSGISFKNFIEKNADHFALESDGKDYMVSLKETKKKKKKKKKKKGKQKGVHESPHRPPLSEPPISSKISTEEQCSDFSENEENLTDNSSGSEWTTVTRTRTNRNTNKVKGSSASAAGTPALQRNVPLSAPTTQEIVVRNLLTQPVSDTLILRDSDEVYKRNAAQFVEDVTSLWNSPGTKGPAHIVLGVQTCSRPPHRLLGLQASTDESVYQSMIPKNMFSCRPQFRYWEILCEDKLIGIVQIDSSRSRHPPSIIASDDMAACGLKKDQLLARKKGRNIHVDSTNLQLGNVDMSSGKSKGTAVQSKQLQQTPVHASSRTEPTQSYAQSVTHQKQTPAAVCSEQSKTSPGVPSKTKQLMSTLNHFQKFHFVLLSGTMNITNHNIEALASAPWIAVYDFNFLGRDNGLLSMLEEEITKWRSFSIFTWRDNCKGITEKGTQWWSLRGRRDISESQTENTVQGWFHIVKDKLEKLCQELAQFAEVYTVLKVLILWPDSELEARCMHKFLSKLQENVPCKMIICYPDSTKDYSTSTAAQLLRLEFSESIEEFLVSMEAICAEVELLTNSFHPSETFLYQLPSADEPRFVLLNEKDNAWLVEDLEVLYHENPCSVMLTDEQLKDEADTFFRGGTIQWSTLYDPHYNSFDVKRAVAEDIMTYIEELIKDGRNGMVTVYHAPGAGGSTMVRRVLWNMHEKAPCVHIKLRSGSSLKEIAEKLTFLYEKCRVPIIALMDGEDESRIKQLSRQLQRHVIILYVKRYPYRYSSTPKPKGEFYLSGDVQDKESQKLVGRYIAQCNDDQTKIESLWKLHRSVQAGKVVQMYEYGMTVYLDKFRGVTAFVEGHLKLEEQDKKELQQWQKCLGFLALVYYYGHSSLPCQFFVSLFGHMSNYKMGLEDFPHRLKVFVVRDNNEGKDQCIRIGHYIIAKEILEQLLSRGVRNPLRKDGCARDRLSPEARRKLKDFAIEFISQATKRKIKSSLTSLTISHILARTFIFRDNEEMRDMNEHGLQGQQKKKLQFSQLMCDLDSEPPYHGRLEVLKKLCDTFPNDPNFRAHLGRFYTCCRPEAEKEAEKHFQEALRLCKEQGGTKGTHEIDDRCKLTLMHVYHMYGMFFQVRNDSLFRSCPDIRNDTSRVGEMLEVIVENADRACENFENSRNATLPGHEESYIYTNEIHVRLNVCDFVQRYFPGGIKAFLAKPGQRSVSDTDTDTVRNFVTQSVTEIDTLIMECYEVQVDEVHQLRKYASWFHRLFSSCSLELERLLTSDRLEHMRLTVAATKLKFRHADDILWTDSLIPEKEITYLVLQLEDILKEAHGDVEDRAKAKLKLDVDYRDWILAIRHTHFRQVYPLEKVLERVRQWDQVCRSPQSVYYHFVLLSLLGIGTASCPGNTECLVDAQLLLEPMQKGSKVIHKSRFPREWLGREDLEGIKRLVTNSNVSHEDRRIKSSSKAKLAVCRGTIGTKFQKAAGVIHLDLGLNMTPVKVFFIPARAVDVEPHHVGARVQFHLAFTLDKGYEAYEVKLLDRYRCSNCPQRVEITWDQQEALCKCGSVVTKNEHTMDF